jgi:hypothetical protein
LSKKATILFLLLNYLNTSVFFPEIIPLFSDSCATEVQDEINSVVEFFTDRCMDTPDTTPEDEDDDIPDGGKFGENANQSELHHVINLQMPLFYHQKQENTYPNHYHFSWIDAHLGSFSPPPEIS